MQIVCVHFLYIIVIMAPSHVVSKIFNVEKYRDIQIPVNIQSNVIEGATI